jgi:hypothetical protein
MTDPDSQLRVALWEMPAANLGGENPLPPLDKARERDVDLSDPEGYLQDDFRYRGYGKGGTRLPYLLQDQYDRTRHQRAFRVAILENRHLRALFLLELGGRLWSLIDKRTGRELLYVNEAFQPANLGYRNAWFSGGVEWNIGVAHHSPLTCSPIFAARVRHTDGTPVLRLWEREGVRGIVYQIDAWLAADSPLLRLRFRVLNPTDRVAPLFQWSNIAVPEREDVRVLVPADESYQHHYGPNERTDLVPVPRVQGVDVSYPQHGLSGKDYFFKIERSRRPWIAALDGGGRGLIQTSTARQIGRKLFLWGMSPGCRRWQRYLGGEGSAYCEIQAGLARTQAESLPMRPGAEWSWLEAYGLMEADAATVHGQDWKAAYMDVDGRLQALLPAERLDREFAASADMAERAPEEILHRGSGWGALERRRCERSGQKAGWPASVVFDDASLTDEQQPWLELLETGVLPLRGPTEEPHRPVVGRAWRRLLETSIRRGASDHWLGWYHLGLMAYADFIGDAPAIRAWRRSLECLPTAWACRCLGAVARRTSDCQEAARLYVEAQAMLPALAPLAAETLAALNQAGRAAEAAALFERMPAAVRANDRVLLARAFTAVKLGDPETVFQIIGSREFVGMQEGEESLARLWFSAHELRLAEAEGIPIDRALRLRVRRECPMPADLDFRMTLVTPEEQVEFIERAERKGN